MGLTTSDSELLHERTPSISNHEAGTGNFKHLLLVRFRIWRYLIATMDGRGSKESVPAYKVDRVFDSASSGSSLQRLSESLPAVWSLLPLINLAISH